MGSNKKPIEPFNSEVYEAARNISIDDAMGFAETHIEAIKYLCALKNLDASGANTSDWEFDLSYILDID